MTGQGRLMCTLAAAMGLAALGVDAAPQDNAGPPAGQVGSARVVPLQLTGDPKARFSMVVLGDGYPAAEMPKFRAHLDRHLNILWSIEPFRSYRNYFNVYAVEIVSPSPASTATRKFASSRTRRCRLQFDGGCRTSTPAG